MKNKLFLALVLSTALWTSCSKQPKPLVNEPHAEQVCFPPPHANQPNTDKPTPGGSDTTVDTPQPGNDCGGCVCTEEFVSVRVQVLDNSNNPVLLDSYYSEDMAGRRLPADLNEYSPIGESYSVVNDSWVGTHQNSTVSVRFIGIKYGIKVVDEVYVINTDCCHVSKSSGKDKVIVP